MLEPVYWWDENGEKCELVEPEIVSYERTHRVKRDGRFVDEQLPDVKFSVVTARRVE